MNITIKTNRKNGVLLLENTQEALGDDNKNLVMS